MSPEPNDLPTSRVTHFSLAHELNRRMEQPQRHRLLHGYPLAGAMLARRRLDPRTRPRFHPNTGRMLLVGVLPHPFCNPRVRGCGFCTFPHQNFSNAEATAVTNRVAAEIEQRLAHQPSLRSQRVAALYFGGATANMTPPSAFRKLCKALAGGFDLQQAEVTLEGVPIHFARGRRILLDILQEELPARTFRVSMGIQTFSKPYLERMGRQGFGDASTFAEAVSEAHRRGMFTSADLLIDLPHQTLREMRQDVLRAIDLGLDHLGLYHLVLFAGLGTEWSIDSTMLSGVPPNESALGNWRALRHLLLSRGFRQTTLTNFERADLERHPRRFVYEEHSFEPHRYEILGFGPSALSFAANPNFSKGCKTMNHELAAEYVRAIDSGLGAWHRVFNYGSLDLRILYITRRLAALDIDCTEYLELFGSDPRIDFRSELDLFEESGLLEAIDERILPTPKGNFYADSIAGVLAWKRLQDLRTPTGPPVQFSNDNSRGHM